MKLIAHRGNINGPKHEYENHPEYILKAINEGLDVEVDVWNDNGQLYLGHDGPEYKIDIYFLKHNHLWCHAKNVSALSIMKKNDIHYFWHQTDDYTITSKGYIWVYPGKKLIPGSIAVKPESKYTNEELKICSGICSDVISKYKNLF